MKPSEFHHNLKYLPLRDLKIDDPFWNRYLKLVTEEIIPYQYDSLCDRIPDSPPSRSIRNLRIAAQLEQGEFEGHVFQDTDLAKWLEAVAYSLAYHPDSQVCPQSAVYLGRNGNPAGNGPGLCGDRGGWQRTGASVPVQYEAASGVCRSQSRRRRRKENRFR